MEINFDDRVRITKLTLYIIIEELDDRFILLFVEWKDV